MGDDSLRREATGDDRIRLRKAGDGESGARRAPSSAGDNPIAERVRSRSRRRASPLILLRMGLYQKWVVPRLIELAMRNDLLDGYRRSAIGPARGLVLEIGVGPGRNLPLYGPAVDQYMRLIRHRNCSA